MVRPARRDREGVVTLGQRPFLGKRKRPATGEAEAQLSPPCSGPPAVAQDCQRGAKTFSSRISGCPITHWHRRMLGLLRALLILLDTNAPALNCRSEVRGMLRNMGRRAVTRTISRIPPQCINGFDHCLRLIDERSPKPVFGTLDHLGNEIRIQA